MNRQTDGGVGKRVRVSISRRIRWAGAAIEPLTFVGASWWLALVAIAVLQQAHDGLHEHLELPPLLHLGRDAALAVPAAALAIFAGTFASNRVAGARRLDRVAAAATWIAVTAVVFALLSIPGNQLHGTLFGAEEEEELSPLADVVLDAGIALIGALLALIPFIAVVGRPTAPSFSPPELAESSGPGLGQRDVVIRSAR